MKQLYELHGVGRSIRRIRQGSWEWSRDSVRRIHETTSERLGDRLVKERVRLLLMPDMGRLIPLLREERKLGCDGYIQWEGAWYGVPWKSVGQTMEVTASDSTVDIGKRAQAGNPSQS